MMRREKRIAKVAMARKLAVRLYWMWPALLEMDGYPTDRAPSHPADDKTRK
jgi:hypothetical protein